MWRIITILLTLIIVVVGVIILTAEDAKAPVGKQDNNNINMSLALKSPAFKSGENIPAKYTCDGEDINPPLEISGIPEDTQSLVIVMDDPDAKKVAGKVWDHWLVWNIPASTQKISEGEEPQGVHGVGTSKNKEYKGPCPPDKTHTYHFKLYALDSDLDLKEGANKKELEKAMENHIIDQAKLLGKYNR